MAIYPLAIPPRSIMVPALVSLACPSSTITLSLSTARPASMSPASGTSGVSDLEVPQGSHPPDGNVKTPAGHFSHLLAQRKCLLAILTDNCLSLPPALLSLSTSLPFTVLPSSASSSAIRAKAPSRISSASDSDYRRLLYRIECPEGTPILIRVPVYRIPFVV